MRTHRLKKPQWLKISMDTSLGFSTTYKLLKQSKLNTVCKEAKCPNIYYCWSKFTATFLILGDICTRNCKFCAVKKGKGGKLDLTEPLRVAKTVKELDLKYVVITSVTRDDLEDGGAKIYAETVEEIKKVDPRIIVELLIPDYTGKALEKVLESKPDVIAHNVEVVRELTPLVRDPKFNYEKSLSVLMEIKRISPTIITKSSLLLGLGEDEGEVKESLEDLRKVNVDIVVMGQYLQPTLNHYPVREYIPLEKFEYYRDIGYKLGFKVVISEPMARTSYKAEESYRKVFEERPSQI